MDDRGACGCFQCDMVIQRHQYWRLSLSRQQGYLGWCLIILQRHETDAANLTDEEIKELWSIVRSLRRALERLFHPDHFNYAFLGNVVRHVHMHVMPRYQAPREFGGREFVDRHWGWFSIPGAEEAPQALLDDLRAAIQAQLAR